MIKVYKKGVHPTQLVDLEGLGLRFLSFNVASLNGELNTKRVQGVDKDFITENGLKGRVINARVYYRKENQLEFQRGKSAVYKLFNNKQKLYFVDTRLGKEVVWEAYVTNEYVLDNEQTTYTKEIELTLFSESPYAYCDKTETATSSTFTINNEGDVKLDARYDIVRIKYTGASNKLRIVNQTNGTEWQYKEATVAGDEIILDSIYPTLNGDNIFGDTNYGVIELNEGVNNFRIFGAEGDFSIEFIYRENHI